MYIIILFILYSTSRAMVEYILFQDYVYENTIYLLVILLSYSLTLYIFQYLTYV